MIDFDLLPIILGILERSFIFCLVIIAAYITSRIIKFDDLSIEGSFCTGGATVAILLVNHVPPLLCIPVVLITGALVGLLTGILYTKVGLNNIMSGIVTTSTAFSLCLYFASSNITLMNCSTLFSLLPFEFSFGMATVILFPLIIITLSTILYLLTTEIGYLLTASGDNPLLVTAMGKSVSLYKIIALCTANSLSALSGALFVQYTGYFSIWSGIGILVIALAGLMLSEMFSPKFGFHLIIGALLYQMIIATTFELNLDPNWNKLIGGILITLIMSIKQLEKRRA